MTEPLFGGYEPPPPPPWKDPDLSPDRRLTLRQQGEISRGVHPLTHGPLHDQASRDASRDDGGRLPLRCGSCVNRQQFQWHDKTYPKCVAHDRVFVKHSTATDVRGWWPACPAYLPSGSWATNESGEG
jgi:hypothetical protein